MGILQEQFQIPSSSNIFMAWPLTVQYLPNQVHYVFSTDGFIEHSDNNHFVGIVGQFLHLKHGKEGLYIFKSGPEVIQQTSWLKTYSSNHLV